MVRKRGRVGDDMGIVCMFFLFVVLTDAPIYRHAGKLTYKFRKSPLNVEFISKAFNLYESMSTPSAQLRALQTTQIVTNCHLMLPLGKNFPDYTLKLMCKIIGKGQPECRAKVLHILHGLMAGTASAEELFQIPNTNIVKTRSFSSCSGRRCLVCSCLVWEVGGDNGSLVA